MSKCVPNSILSNYLGIKELLSVHVPECKQQKQIIDQLIAHRIKMRLEYRVWKMDMEQKKLCKGLRGGQTSFFKDSTAVGAKGWWKSLGQCQKIML